MDILYGLKMSLIFFCVVLFEQLFQWQLMRQPFIYKENEVLIQKPKQ